MSVPTAKTIELVMRGSLDAAAWHDGLCALARAIGAEHLLVASPASPDAAPLVCGWGTGAANILVFASCPAEASELAHMLVVCGAKQGEIAPRTILSQIPVFDAAIRKLGARNLAVARLSPDGFVVACRGHTHRGFTDSQKNAMTALLPVISSAMAVKQRLAALQEQVAVLDIALDTLATGVILLDAHKRVVRANAVAADLLRRADVLCVAPSGLRAVTTPQNERLTQAITSCAGATALIRCESTLPVVIRAVRAPAEAGDAATTILFVNDPNRSKQDRLADVCAACGFTHRESEISALLAGGMECLQIAAALGITIGNLRGHLNRIFTKANVGSQAQLVSLLLALSP